MLAHFESLFGAYPFDAYGVVSSTHTSGSPSRRRASRCSAPVSQRRVPAHELAHQWFGDSVTPATPGRTSGSTRGSRRTPSGAGATMPVSCRSNPAAGRRTPTPRPIDYRVDLADPGAARLFDPADLRPWRARPARAAPHSGRRVVASTSLRDLGRPVPLRQRLDRRLRQRRRGDQRTSSSTTFFDDWLGARRASLPLP